MTDRKELIREYKRTPKEMGVYRITNKVNGKSFVAASPDIQARFNRHRMELRTKGEQSRSLLADWIEFGEDAFEFEIVDLLEPLDKPGYNPAKDLKTLEEMWLEKLKPFEPHGYNRPARA